MSAPTATAPPTSTIASTGPGIRVDVVVIGAGHAGIEAASAAARLGCKVMVLTQNLDSIGRMSCNPSVGGLAKGQLVREIDAMGGVMAKLTDATGIQFRILNQSKGPAVQSPRSQNDRRTYAQAARRFLEHHANIRLFEGEVVKLLTEPVTPNDGASTHARGAAHRIIGVETAIGLKIFCGAVVLCTGTFMRGLMHCGDSKISGGRAGAPAAVGISNTLAELGFDLRRLKTGTSPRIDGRTINFAALEPEPGDNPPAPFSFETDPDTFRPKQLDCYVTFTTKATMDLVKANYHKCPMFTGQIEGTGPRYCPSIEVKAIRFPDKEKHNVFVEPEGFDTDEVYLSGMSTSMPPQVQDELVRTLPGLERANILRYGYAVEYDFLPASQVDRGMMTRRIAGFFTAGQIMGTSGYEEAAGQGLLAGLNAALWLGGREEAFGLGRDQAYIGVMVDDLITKTPLEPYRMFTSRAEYRLLLRSDNADRRLVPIAAKIGAVSQARLEKVQALEAEIARGLAAMKTARLEGATAQEWLRRPQVTMAEILARFPNVAALGLSRRALEQIEIEVKYEGYFKVQLGQIERQAKLEDQHLPSDFDYHRVPNLANEARETLSRVRPDSVGQAARISGIKPTDIASLLIHLNVLQRQRKGRGARPVKPVVCSEATEAEDVDRD